MTFAIDMVTDCSVITVALFLAVNMKCPGRTGVRTDIARPAHRTVAPSGYGMTIALDRDIPAGSFYIIKYFDIKIYHQQILE